MEKAVWDAISTLEGLGAAWKEVSLPHTRYALAAYYVIAMSEASSNLARFDGLRYGLRKEEDQDWHTTYSEIRAEGFGPEVKRRILLGTYALSAGYYGRYYLKALKVRTLIKDDFLRAFKDVDLIAGPTMPIPAFRIGERINDPLSLYLADVFTVPINLAGVPAVSLPCGFAGHLPIGLQLIGRHFQEDLLLRAAQRLRGGHSFPSQETGGGLNGDGCHNRPGDPRPAKQAELQDVLRMLDQIPCRRAQHPHMSQYAWGCPDPCRSSTRKPWSTASG